MRVARSKGWKVSTGLYYARLHDAWSPPEIVVDASSCQLPLTLVVDIGMSPGDITSISVVPLVKIKWDDVAVHPEPRLPVNCIQTKGVDTNYRQEPPADHD